MIQVDPESARPWLEQGISVARSSAQSIELVELLCLAATSEDMAGDFEKAARFLDEAVIVSAATDAYDAEIAVLQGASVHAYMRGDIETAQAKSSAGAELSRAQGDLYYLEQMHMNLGLQQLAAGDRARSRSSFIEGLRLARQIDNRLYQYYLVRLLSWHAALARDYRLAARLAGAAEVIGSASGALMTGPYESVLQADLQRAAEALGPAKYADEYRLGARLKREAAVRLALGESEASGEDGGRDDLSPLGKREAEVARLIAEGLSNKEIATRLLISDRTVTTHVQNILNKLGFDSRSQVASWYATKLP
jgi:ATP/maltotriose-dependent transcriptional regulator MalT